MDEKKGIIGLFFVLTLLVFSVSFVSAGLFTGKATEEDVSTVFEDRGITAYDASNCVMKERDSTYENWEGLSTYSSAHPEIAAYRIQWFAGDWSDWYIPGENDISPKYNDLGENRRMWSLFEDHHHEYIVCSDDGELTKCSESDAGREYGEPGKTTVGGLTREDYCEGDYLIEFSCDGEAIETKKEFCENGCNNGACIEKYFSFKLSSPVGGDAIDSVETANSICEKEFGSGYQWAEFHDEDQWDIEGKLESGEAGQRAWVWIDDQDAECFSSGKGMTWYIKEDKATCHGPERSCNPYEGGTSCAESKPLLCIKEKISGETNETTNATDCADSDNSKDYSSISVSSRGVTKENFPAFFEKGKGKGNYEGSDRPVIYGNDDSPSIPEDSPHEYSLYYDFCYSETQLNEAYCNSEGKLAAHGIQCPDGCKDGACLNKNETEEVLLSLNESFEFKGNVISFIGANDDLQVVLKMNGEIYALEEGDKKTVGKENEINVKLLDVLISNIGEEDVQIKLGLKSLEDDFEENETEKYILDEPAEECIDKDKGKNYGVKGRTYDKGAVKPWTDACLNKTHLTEHWCGSDGRLKGGPHKCEGKCLDGICVDETNGTEVETNESIVTKTLSVRGNYVMADEYELIVKGINIDDEIAMFAVEYPADYFQDTNMKQFSLDEGGSTKIVESEDGKNYIKVIVDDVFVRTETVEVNKTIDGSDEYYNKTKETALVKFKFISVSKDSRSSEEDNETTEEDCNGCSYKGECVPISFRDSGKYCSFEGGMVKQLGEGDECSNNFECQSNVCANGECISQGFLEKVMNWFRRVFGGGTDNGGTGKGSSEENCREVWWYNNENPHCQEEELCEGEKLGKNIFQTRTKCMVNLYNNPKLDACREDNHCDFDETCERGRCVRETDDGRRVVGR